MSLQPKPVILVPRRADDGPRDALWDWCRAWWEREQSHMPIIEGHHEEGPFNRSAAINTAARLAGEWDVAVIIDSDVICDPERIKVAVHLAYDNGKLVYPHDMRKDLNPLGSKAVMAGVGGNWDRWVHRRYAKMVSSVIVVSRHQWDEVGGFDETFRGWGYEDTAFAAACETFGGSIRMEGDVWHFWHPTNPKEKRGSLTHQYNSARGQRYRAAIGDPAAIRALQAEAVPEEAPSLTIPRILHRVVPEVTSEVSEQWWEDFRRLHPDWRLMTHRDPLDPDEWPLTSPHWSKVRAGAQLADLIRMEALLKWGGVYVDSDVQPFRSFEPLLGAEVFAGWEDDKVIPNAIIGARPGHPAIRECLDLTIKRTRAATRHPGKGVWDAGPGVTTQVLPKHDALLLPPGSLYPVHYNDPDRDAKMRDFAAKPSPWVFAMHWYAGSWLPEGRQHPLEDVAA